MNNLKLKLLICLVLLSQAACVSSANFSCPDAKGGRCMMLSEIDAKVSNGEIEKFHQSKRCFGRSCDKSIDSKPRLAGNKDLMAKIFRENEPEEYLDGDELYVK